MAEDEGRGIYDLEMQAKPCPAPLKGTEPSHPQNRWQNNYRCTAVLRHQTLRGKAGGDCYVKNVFSPQNIFNTTVRYVNLPARDGAF